MNAPQFRRLTTSLAFIICCLACTHKGWAQVITLDSNKLKLIQIHHADSLVIVKDDDKNFNKLFGAVSLEHDGVVMNCDSAYFFLEQNYASPRMMRCYRFSSTHIPAAHYDYPRYHIREDASLITGNAPPRIIPTRAISSFKSCGA